MTSLTLREKTLKKYIEGILPTIFFVPNHHCVLLLQLYQELRFSNRNFFCEEPKEMHTTQSLELFIIYLEGFNMSTANKDPIAVAEDLSFSLHH